MSSNEQLNMAGWRGGRARNPTLLVPSSQLELSHCQSGSISQATVFGYDLCAPANHPPWVFCLVLFLFGAEDVSCK